MRQTTFFLWLLTTLFTAVELEAQELANTHWHFAAGTGLFHNGTGLESTTSSIDVLADVTPATISDADGDLLFYTDGQQVHGADGAVIANGIFSNLGLTSLFLPVPDDENRYYLFRSAEWGVDYSVIDLTLNGGAGGIVDDLKEINFHPHSAELMAAHKANSVNYWLILADNASGGSSIVLRSFEVSETDVTFSADYSFSYIFAGWYQEVDDARLAPDCSKIAVLHKGHYLTLYRFDNETGEVFDPLANAVDTQTAFTQRCNMEFSPNGEYIYVIGDFTKVDRFSLDTWDNFAISGSQTVVAQADFGTPTWQDIKLGPYGDLYLYNKSDQLIDILIDPNVEDGETGVESTEFSLISGNYFFPNSPNLSCVSFSFPVLQGDGFCLGDTTVLGFNFGVEVEEIIWDFGADGISTGPANENPTWALYEDEGTYEITLELFYFDTWHTYTFNVSVGEEPQVELGEGGTFCEGETVTLSVPENPTYEINWSTGQTEPEINISTGGTYSVVVDNLGCVVSDTVDFEMIPQIDVLLEDAGQCAEAGNVVLDASNSATDDYLWNTGATEPSIEVATTGTYWVTLTNACFTVVDTAEVILVTFPEVLLPEDQSFCAGEEVVLTSSFTDGNISWNTGDTGPSITVSQAGAYFVSINFAGCETADTTFVSVIPEVSVALEDFVFCESGTALLDATDPAATGYQWSTGSTEPTISVDASGSYWVIVENACFSATDTSEIEVVVFPDPLLPQGLSACSGDTVELSPAFAGGDIQWNTGETAPSIVVTESGFYSVSIEYLGCLAFEETEVEFQDFSSLGGLEMPNVFSPNGDNLNREFRPFLPEDPDRLFCGNNWFDADITIYNRWGNEIHKGICAWDGTNANGRDMSDGTYFYLVNLRAACYERAEEDVRSGTVTLVR